MNRRPERIAAAFEREEAIVRRAIAVLSLELGDAGVAALLGATQDDLARWRSDAGQVPYGIRVRLAHLMWLEGVVDDDADLTTLGREISENATRGAVTFLSGAWAALADQPAAERYRRVLELLDTSLRLPPARRRSD